jgi:large subunit ribosomal protein L25
MAEIVLNVELRESAGTGNARATRRAGLVPGVLYGGDKDPVSVTVKANEFRKALYTGKLLGHLVTLKYGDETQPVIAKAIDMHPVTDVPQHFDLYRVDAHQQIKINVPLHFTHHEESPGLKRGGTLNVAFHDVQVSCAADHIPEELLVDLTGIDIGGSVRVSDLTFPANVTPTVPVDTVVATVAGASSQADEDEAADAAVSEEAAGEAAAAEPAATEEGGEA